MLLICLLFYTFLLLVGPVEATGFDVAKIHIFFQLFGKKYVGLGTVWSWCWAQKLQPESANYNALGPFNLATLQYRYRLVIFHHYR